MIAVLQVGPLPDAATTLLSRSFTLHHAEHGAGTVRGIATSGKASVSRELMDRLPELEIIACLGAGTDGIDGEAAAKRGIRVATTAHVLADDVADVAMGMIVSLSRDFRGAERFVRDGAWGHGKYPLGHALKGANLGIVGLGTIGAALARRADAFGMRIGYHTRSVRPSSPYRHFADLPDMARWCRFLAVCCPGGEATRHLVGAEVLHALGPTGTLINVARGSVVDEAALTAALDGNHIAGAGLDVFADEPHPHPALLASPRCLLLPHIGSATQETRHAMTVAMVEALTGALGAEAL
ncbi:MAG TPA: 2-hydroxyacid dehydrogenase [Xanthobacteraceae bacterium]|nr:2-hydroxyacid dehydrogenase [Xanthobacteraceae bacterium]